jgi:hypothetical protein
MQRNRTHIVSGAFGAVGLCAAFAGMSKRPGGVLAPAPI